MISLVVALLEALVGYSQYVFFGEFTLRLRIGSTVLALNMDCVIAMEVV